jgi:hypothetical protein
VVRVAWEPAGSSRLRWPLEPPRGSLVRFSGWEALLPRPGVPRLACKDAWARDWYGSADQAGDGSGVITGSAAAFRTPCRDTGQPCNTKILA